MLRGVKQFFDSLIDPAAEAAGRDQEHALRLAVAVLLVEVAEADYRDHPDEQRVLLNAVMQNFALPPDEAGALVELARQEHRQATDYFQFTRLINQRMTPEQKIQVVECLWRVAFADAELHHYEEHVIRRLAELIHLPHSEFIAAKHRVREGD